MTRGRALLLVTAVALTACPGRLDDPDRFKKCMLNVEQDIFVTKCGMAGCHEATNPQNGLDLVSSGVAMRIKTGISTCNSKPLISFIAEKLTAAPACGSSMPLGNPLSSTEVKCVHDYLASLADGGT